MSPRRFEWVGRYADAGFELPRRQTAGAAGYDLAAAEDVVVAARSVALVPTGVRAILPEGEFLAIHARSSLATRLGLILANGVGIVDADYAANPTNAGHIFVALRNLGDEPVRIARGQRIAQAIFQRFERCDEEGPAAPRVGGFGSTGQS